MKFAPFILILYYNFGTFQLPGSLPLPSVPPFPTSWETLQVVCCPIWLSSKYNVLFNSALPLLCSEPIMKIRQSNSEIFWNRATLVGVFAPFHFSNERGGGRGGDGTEKHSNTMCHFTGDRCQTALHGRKFSHFHIVHIFCQKTSSFILFYIAWTILGLISEVCDLPGNRDFLLF